jgi:hypothetical protein
MVDRQRATKSNPNTAMIQESETAWVVQTYETKFLVKPKVFAAKFQLIQADWAEIVKNDPMLKSLDEVELNRKEEEYYRQRCETEKLRRRVLVQQVAFYDLELAKDVAGHIIDSLPPVEMKVSDISVRVDRYRNEAQDRKIPFFVVLENGEFTMEDNPYEILEIKNPSRDPDYPAIYSGTFWARSYQEAIKDAKYWEGRQKW